MLSEFVLLMGETLVEKSETKSVIVFVVFSHSLFGS